MSTRKIRWENLGSVRLWFGSFLGGVIAGTLADMAGLHAVAVVIAFAVMGLLFLVNLTEQVYYCPHCRKRVKMGAAVCHHCGRNVR